MVTSTTCVVEVVELSGLTDPPQVASDGEATLHAPALNPVPPIKCMNAPQAEGPVSEKTTPRPGTVYFAVLAALSLPPVKPTHAAQTMPL